MQDLVYSCCYILIALAMRFEAMQIELFSCNHQYFTLHAIIEHL